MSKCRRRGGRITGRGHGHGHGRGGGQEHDGNFAASVDTTRQRPTSNKNTEVDRASLPPLTDS